MAKTSVRILLALFLASALLGLSSPIGAAGVSPQKHPKPAIATEEGKPIEVWSIIWTSTRVGSSRITGSGFSIIENYTYNESLSLHYNIYADGTNDDTDFNLHVADEDDGVIITANCPAPAKSIDHWHIITQDPDSYNGNPEGRWWLDPYQNNDNSWSADLGSPAYPFYFNEADHDISTDCYGVTSVTNSINNRQWVYPADTCLPPTLQGNAQGTEFTYHGEGDVDDGNGCSGPTGFTLNGGQGSVHWTVDITARLLGARDLTVDRLEVTQGLQDEANSIPLVQGRSTVVRAFVNIGTDPGPVDGVTGELEGSAGGTKLGSVYPFNLNGQISAPSEPDWKNINDTLNFQIPLAWTQYPTLTLKVKVNPNHSVVEENYDNDELSQTVQLGSCPGLTIGYVPIHYAPPGGYTPANPGNVDEAPGFMQKIYPVADNKIFYTPLSISLAVLQDINKDTQVANNLLDYLNSNLLVSPRPEQIFGWMPSQSLSFNGHSEEHASIGNDTPLNNLWRVIFAHEIAHNYGLEDGTQTTAGNHWFDVYDRTIKPVPAGLGGPDLVDLMDGPKLIPGGEPWAWISGANYVSLYNQMCTGTGKTAVTAPSLPQGGTSLLVSGIISNTTPVSASLDPLIEMPAMPDDILPGGSQYCLNLEDASKYLLSSYCFNEEFGSEWGIPTTAIPFEMTVPYPTGLHQVDLVETSSGSVLSSRVASAHAPTVTVNYPNASGLTLNGPQTITWTGSDADHDPLTYAVLYSPDNGTTWYAESAGLSGTSYSLDFSDLAGTTGASGLIKVVASDGFYSTEDTSDAPFTVANKPPSAIILSPSSGVAFSAGPKIDLEGSGLDLEQGKLPDSALSWASSLDGPLGNGQILETTLSPGVHTITLTVTDSHGLTDTDSIQLTVIQSTPEQAIYLPLIER